MGNTKGSWKELIEASLGSECEALSQLRQIDRERRSFYSGYAARILFIVVFQWLAQAWMKVQLPTATQIYGALALGIVILLCIVANAVYCWRKLTALQERERRVTSTLCDSVSQQVAAQLAAEAARERNGA